MNLYRHTITLAEPVTFESYKPAGHVEEADILNALDSHAGSVRDAFEIETEFLGVEVPRPRPPIRLVFERKVRFGALEQTRLCWPNQIDAIVHNMNREGYELVCEEPA